MINASMLLFADDTKIYKQINNQNDQMALQDDINKMCECSQEWLLKYHPDKCKSMRIGPKDKKNFIYSINNHPLEYTQEEKDLGVIIDDNLKFDAHISSKVNIANSIMGLIRRTFTYLDQTIFTRLFKALVRPHIEYANSVWHPTTLKLKNMIENVQRRATKSLPCCAGMEYEERLRKLDLPCLAYRKLRGDLIEVYKMCNDHYDNQISPPISRAKDVFTRATRGREYNLQRSIAIKKVRTTFFRNRVVPFWNELPTKVLEAPSTKSFERRLDKYWRTYNIKYNFDKCLDFERQRVDPDYAGTGPRNVKPNQAEDLELQAL